MTTYFQSAHEDAPFIAQINENFPEPANQPYLFYLLAGKQFYLELKSKPNEELLMNSSIVVQTYKTAFQSRYSMEELMEKAEATVAFFAGDLQIVLTISSHSLLVEMGDNCISLSQGNYKMRLSFSSDNKLASLSF